MNYYYYYYYYIQWKQIYMVITETLTMIIVNYDAGYDDS